MKTAILLFCIFLGAFCAEAGAAVSTAPSRVSFRFDTRPAFPVTTLSSPVTMPYAQGATVVATAPDGGKTTLVSSAASAGTEYWTASSGGIWTVNNNKEGTATFVVRYSLFGTQGAGTEASPYRIVDNDELSGLSVSDGFIVMLEGPLASISRMARPSGFAISSQGEGMYRLVSSSDGAAFIALRQLFPLDTVQEGPDRRIVPGKEILPIAYSGDDWAFSSLAASTLTFTSPAGAVTAVDRTGTGVYVPDFPIKGQGEWTIVLSGDGVATLTGHINRTGGFLLFVR